MRSLESWCALNEPLEALRRRTVRWRVRDSKLKASSTELRKEGFEETLITKQFEGLGLTFEEPFTLRVSLSLNPIRF